MIQMQLDKRSVKKITDKLKKLPQKMQRTAIRKTIDPEAKRIKNQFKSITPKGKRQHKNKYAKKTGSGFLKTSFSVRNSGRGLTAGRKIITTAKGYYIFASPNETGRKAGTKGKHKWGAVSGAGKYSRYWRTEQTKTLNNLNKSLGLELTRL